MSVRPRICFQQLRIHILRAFQCCMEGGGRLTQHVWVIVGSYDCWYQQSLFTFDIYLNVNV